MRSGAAGGIAGGAARPARPRSRPRWLTFSLRRAGCCLALVVIAVGSFGFVGLSRQPVSQNAISDALDRLIAVSAALGLVVTDIRVEGRETTDTTTIMRALAAERGTPMLAVSPERAKRQLESLPWIRSAAIERRLPHTLFVRLVERRPLAVWQHGGKQELIDRDGEVIAVKDLAPFARLPSVVGDDAAAHAAKLLDALTTEPELAARVTAAIRVDDRRWNLRIDSAIEVLLPEQNAAAAWTRLAELERSSKLLKREVQTVDMRLPDRLVLHVHAAPASETTPAKKPHSPGKNT
jgi:cell division protein FtsQ